MVSGVARVARCSHLSGWPYMTAKGGTSWKKTPRRLRPKWCSKSSPLPKTVTSTLSPAGSVARGHPAAMICARKRSTARARLPGRSGAEVRPEHHVRATHFPPPRVGPRSCAARQCSDADGPREDSCIDAPSRGGLILPRSRASRRARMSRATWTGSGASWGWGWGSGSSSSARSCLGAVAEHPGAPLTLGLAAGCIAYGAAFAALGGLTAASVAWAKATRARADARGARRRGRSAPSLARTGNEPALAGPLGHRGHGAGGRARWMVAFADWAPDSAQTSAPRPMRASAR